MLLQPRNFSSRIFQLLNFFSPIFLLLSGFPGMALTRICSSSLRPLRPLQEFYITAHLPFLAHTARGIIYMELRAYRESTPPHRGYRRLSVRGCIESARESAVLVHYLTTCQGDLCFKLWIICSFLGYSGRRFFFGWNSMLERETLVHVMLSVPS